MDPRELKDSAADLFRKGKFTKAAESYLQLSKLEPKEPQHLIKLGDSYRRDGKKEPAIEAYRRAVDDYARSGIVIKAIAACKLILEIDSSHRDAQEALANLCAKRYVKRDQVEEKAGPRGATPASKVRGNAPIELPDDDGEGEIETTSQKEKTEEKPAAKPAPAPMTRPNILSSSAPRPAVPASPPPRVEPAKHTPAPKPAEAAAEDLIDIDVGEMEAAPAPKPKAAFVPPPPRPSAPEPTEIEMDLDMGGGAEAPPSSRPGVIDLSAEADAMDVIDSEPLEEMDEVSEVEFATAETTGEHRVINSARHAASRPPTPMADMLSESLLVDTGIEEGEEVELLSVTAGEAMTPPPAPSRPSVIAPPPPPATPAVIAPPPPAAMAPPPPTREELAADEAEIMRMGNDASFDVGVPDSAPDLDAPSEQAAAAPTMAIPMNDLEQKSVPLFSDLPPEAFVDLLERLDFKRIDAGQAILREGDPGKSIFVLASGKAKVIKGYGTDKPIELAELDDGAFFGEMALLNGSPRVASVVASEDTEVLEIKEDLLRELTTKHASVGVSLKKFYRQRLLANVMAISPLFRAFDKGDRKMLVEKFKLREVKAEEAIIKQGEKPDGLYVVMHGVALVTRKDDASGRVLPLAALKEGDVFGEMSLLRKKPATATVTAKRRTLVLRLPKADFDEIMFTHPALLEVVSELTDERMKVNEAILSGNAAASREALALL